MGEDLEIKEPIFNFIFKLIFLVIIMIPYLLIVIQLFEYDLLEVITVMFCVTLFYIFVFISTYFSIFRNEYRKIILKDDVFILKKSFNKTLIIPLENIHSVKKKLYGFEMFESVFNYTCVIKYNDKKLILRTSNFQTFGISLEVNKFIDELQHRVDIINN